MIPSVVEALEGLGAAIAFAVFGGSVLGLAGLMLLGALDRIVKRWSGMSNAERVTVFASILVGAGVSVPFHMMLFGFWPWGPPVSTLLMVIIVAIAHAMISSMEEALPWSKLGGYRSNWKVFDTSVIIDGRIYEVAKSGFLEGRLYIPQFVIQELQSIADSHDANRRQRGRRGLDMLENLRKDFEVEIGTYDRYGGQPTDPVDDKLVRLAAQLGAALVTNDFNLNKVAKVQGVRVFNVNDLAMAVRLQYLPGEAFSVEIEREGSQAGQGVGFLNDGTMVVVENGQELIGQRAEVRITQIHQSTAGKMIFASINCNEPSEEVSHSRKRR